MFFGRGQGRGWGREHRERVVERVVVTLQEMQTAAARLALRLLWSNGRKKPCPSTGHFVEGPIPRQGVNAAMFSKATSADKAHVKRFSAQALDQICQARIQTGLQPSLQDYAVLCYSVQRRVTKPTAGSLFNFILLWKEFS